MMNKPKKLLKPNGFPCLYKEGRDPAKHDCRSFMDKYDLLDIEITPNEKDLLVMFDAERRVDEFIRHMQPQSEVKDKRFDEIYLHAFGGDKFPAIQAVYRELAEPRLEWFSQKDRNIVF